MKSAAILLVALLATSAQADTLYSAQVGGEKRTYRVTVNRLFEPKFVSEFGKYSIMMHPEVGVSFWHGPNGGSVQLSAVPMLRANLNPRWFVEAGIGVSYFTDTTFAEQDITTRWQFADHLGVGWRYGPSIVVGVRASHFSNAGFKRPNPGVNALQLSLTKAF
jgi:lipid A 3-O-deacylase